ncbi:MAG: CoA ester lyase [Pseudomonadota bacterium]
MSKTDRPRRSMLYMPGSNARAIEKGRDLPADAIIFDIEDAVAVDAKSLARNQIRAAVAAGGYGAKELLVRINGLDTEWIEADIDAVAPSGADGVLVPKVDGPETVQEVERRLVAAGAPNDLAIWCMMETPMGILRAREIAAASPRVAGMIMGTNDLALDLRCRQTPEGEAFQASFGLCILAARAYGIAVIDAVFNDLSDDAGFADSCRRGRMLGFDGKSLIHPKTIDAANRLYGPTEDDLRWANRIIEAFDAARAAGKGVITVDGRMVEELHVREAQRLVAMARVLSD